MATAMETRVDSLETILGRFIVYTGISLDRMERDTAALKDEMRDDRKRMNRQWGELSNKLGTFVEDISAPNIPFVAEKRFGLSDHEFFEVRVQRRHGTDRSKEMEIDVLAVYANAVVVNEAKSSARIQSVDGFLEHLAVFFDYFPEYNGRKIVPVFSSLYILDDLVAYMSGKGIYAMGMREGTMDILNPPER